ncbi:MAG: hypothetical protein EXX96DRAFT_630045 [Benjaminiella poitrasii]|nr:MAG: hypothetical protein EXX96DRAFT_630045 [Benjaminiella poitrasii]
MGLKFAEYDDQSGTFTLLFLSHFLVALLICLGSLSCWKIISFCCRLKSLSVFTKTTFLIHRKSKNPPHSFSTSVMSALQIFCNLGFIVVMLIITIIVVTIAIAINPNFKLVRIFIDVLVYIFGFINAYSVFNVDMTLSAFVMYDLQGTIQSFAG